MALKIIDECIACDACFEVCPSGAVKCADPIYIINESLCTECVGYKEDENPSCSAVCPVDAIVIDERYERDRDTLLKKFKRNNP